MKLFKKFLSIATASLCFLTIFAPCSNALFSGMHGKSPETVRRMISSGDIDGIRYLLNIGANVDSKDPDGNTALHCAAYTSTVEMVQFLLQRGADPNIKGNCGTTPLMLAVHREDKQAALALANLFVHQPGIDLSAQNNQGINALRAALNPFRDFQLEGDTHETKSEAIAISKILLFLYSMGVPYILETQETLLQYAIYKKAFHPEIINTLQFIEQNARTAK